MPIQYVTTKTIFSAPRKSILVVSADCSGSTLSSPARIQTQLRERFTSVYDTYVSHCQSHDPSQLLGTCLLIQEENYWIACLFTYNIREKVDPHAITQTTQTAVIDLLRKLHSHSFISTLLPGDEYFPTLHFEKLNSDIIHWQYTESALVTLPFNFLVYNF